MFDYSLIMYSKLLFALMKRINMEVKSFVCVYKLWWGKADGIVKFKFHFDHLERATLSGGKRDTFFNKS